MKIMVVRDIERVGDDLLVITLEFSAVVALFKSDSLSDRLTGIAMPLSTSMAFSAALWYDSDIVVG